MKMTKEEQQKRRAQGREFSRRQEEAGLLRCNVWLTVEEKAKVDLMVAERKAKEQIAEAQMVLEELQKKAAPHPAAVQGHENVPGEDIPF